MGTELLTAARVQTLAQNEEVRDTLVPGFSARRQVKAVTFSFTGRLCTGKKKRVLIGTHGNPWTVEAARERARQISQDYPGKNAGSTSKERSAALPEMRFSQRGGPPALSRVTGTSAQLFEVDDWEMLESQLGGRYMVAERDKAARRVNQVLDTYLVEIRREHAAATASGLAHWSSDLHCLSAKMLAALGCTASGNLGRYTAYENLLRGSLFQTVQASWMIVASRSQKILKPGVGTPFEVLELATGCLSLLHQVSGAAAHAYNPRGRQKRRAASSATINLVRRLDRVFTAEVKRQAGKRPARADAPVSDRATFIRDVVERFLARQGHFADANDAVWIRKLKALRGDLIKSRLRTSS